MDYADLLGRALSKAPIASSLAEVLSRIDAIDKTVLTFDEFNSALQQLVQRGHTGAQAYVSTMRATYDAAVAANRDLMWQLLEQQRLSRANAEAILERYAGLMRKNET
ncbi:MAG: hypothetical protein ACXWCP_15795 [Burkholderiales bacterium]